MRIFILVVGSIFCLLLQACGAGAGGNKPAAPIEVPPNAIEEWTLAAPADVGMDGAMLGRAVSELPAPAEHGLASMLVLRRGKPVLEQYWNGYNKDTLHDLRSATKSITALMVGIAIDQHFLSGVDEPLVASLGHAYPDAPALARGITLDHALTMSTGLACDDRTASSPGNESAMYRTTDWVKFVLNLPQAAAPGSETHYCTGGAVTLGRVIAEASKRSVPAFAEAYLFAPLGIANVRWADFDNHKQTDTGGHLQMRPRDLAKLGQLVVQKGLWKDKQLVSAAWIGNATRQHVLIDNGWKYGYLWWMKLMPYKGRQVMMQFAWGNGGQYIFTIPELELVVVFTGENYDSDKADLPFDILKQSILPAIQ
jgi:CubicO group peptidase (beta-lactamase class C family)